MDARTCRRPPVAGPASGHQRGEGDELTAHGGERIDLGTGAVWPQAARDHLDEVGDELDEEDAEGERWLWVDSLGSRPGYRDMEAFIADLDQ